jgi:hypothetical protein
VLPVPVGSPLLGHVKPCSEGAEFVSKKPNIVVIPADDAGCGGLGCYGSPVNRTPRFDLHDMG